jgi:hypothetical protein
MAAEEKRGQERWERDAQMERETGITVKPYIYEHVSAAPEVARVRECWRVQAELKHDIALTKPLKQGPHAS